MKKHSKSAPANDAIEKLIGLGKTSKAKSYYPDLRNKVDELQLEKEKYQSIFISAQEGIFRAKIDGSITDINPAMKNILYGESHKNEEAEEPEIQNFFYDTFLWSKILVTLENERKIIGLQTKIKRPDLQERWVSLNLILNVTGDARIIEGMVEDITQRKKAEDDLLATKSYLDSIIDSMPSILIGVDNSGQINSMNRYAEDITGFVAEEVSGKKVDEVLPVYNSFFTNYNFQNPSRIVHQKYTIQSDNEEQYVAISAYPLVGTSQQGTIIVIDDITEAERREEQLQRAQKMEVVGVLAGGIAHDFNNLLTGSMGAVSLLKSFLERGTLNEEFLHKNLQIIENANIRSSEMVRRLLSLSKQETPQFKNVDLKNLIDQVVDISKSSLDKTIELKINVPDTKMFIQADRTQLEQILLNLVINGAHAMTIMRPEGHPWGGQLSLSLHMIHRRNPHFDKIMKHWALIVRDTGIGMSKEIREQIFTPFFTTKDQQDGSGLGLSQAYTIMDNHQGMIEVNSRQAMGTAFTLFFPVVEDEILEETSQHEHQSSNSPGGTVLVIDDEEMVRNIIQDMLTAGGYHFVTAKDGKDGIEKYLKKKDSIDAVILDLSMPGMSGREVYEELCRINPTVKVVIASGYSDDKRLDQLLAQENTVFLPKPFSMSKLSKALSKILM